MNLADVESRKPNLPEGYVETPHRRRSRRSGTPGRATSPGSDGEELSKDNTFTEGTAHLNGGMAPTGAKEEKHVIDGWEEGSDPKIDLDPQFHFGGPLGVSAVMLGFPILMYYMWIGATYYDGKLPMRSSSKESWSHFLRHLCSLVYEGAFPHARAWTIYWSFLQCAFYLFLPGVYAKGKKLPHQGGEQLDYYFSGFW